MPCISIHPLELFSPSRISRSQEWTQHQGNSQERAIHHNYRRFSADLGRGASRDVITTHIQPNPSSIHVRQTGVQLKGLIYRPTSLRKTISRDCNFASSSSFPGKKKARKTRQVTSQILEKQKKQTAASIKPLWPQRSQNKILYGLTHTFCTVTTCKRNGIN